MLSKYNVITLFPNLFDEWIKTGIISNGLDKNILKNAFQSGSINYSWRNKDFSIRRDTLFIYDLELSENIIPKNVVDCQITQQVAPAPTK